MGSVDTRLLQRLLRDGAFREQFRRDPAAAARNAGLDELAEQLERDDTDPMETLEPRESRSSLAGVLMAAAVEGLAIYEGGHHLLPPVDAAEAATTSPGNNDGWAFVRLGASFPGDHPNYEQLRAWGASGVLWMPDDPDAAAGMASSRQAGLKAGIWLVPGSNEHPEAFARRAADAIERYKPDRIVLDVEAIGKGYHGSVGWQWSDSMMNTFARLAPSPPPLAVTVEPMQDDFNYAAYTSRGAQVWPQSYLGDMTPKDPQAVIDRVAANGVARDLIVPVLGPKQVDGYAGVHNLYTADDIQGRTPPPPPPPAPPGVTEDAIRPRAPRRNVPVARKAEGDPGGDGGRSPPATHPEPRPVGWEQPGGAASPDALALLNNPRLVFDAAGVADLRAGRIDPRVVSVLDQLSQRHRLTISSMRSDHPRLTTGGSVSNHFHGRAFDIAAVDGRPVSPDNAAARQLALDLARLDARIRPSEIGSPWRLEGAAYFTDGAHQNHLHVGFDQPLDGNWSPPSTPRAVVAAAQLSADPDDWEGNLDDEDGGADEVDGSNEDEEDEGGGEDDDGGTDEEDEGGDDEAEGEDESGEDDEDNGVDEQGEGSNGEDANDDSDDSGDSDTGSDATDSGGDEPPDMSGVDGAYPGDGAPREQLAAWMASAAQQRGLPPELPVMAALTESSLRNLDYGDADSVGFFQMRTSIWDRGTYKGYAQKPELQLKWFLDRAVDVKQQRLARGQAVDDPNQYGEWVADVENPAAQYRGRYQVRLEEARGLLAHAGTKGHSGADVVEAADAAVSITAGPRALTALAEARRFMGTPYKWGGSSPSTGFDCSGLVQWAYAHAGIRIPRVTDQQILAPNGVAVDRKHLVPGDLVFFRDSTGYVHHVGISLGGDRFVHAPHTGDVVKISSLKESYYAQQFTGGRRFDAAVSGAARASASAAEANDRASAVRLAQAALDRDAAEVQRSGSALAKALRLQEQRNEELHNAVQFLRAVDPSLVSQSGDKTR